ncbi:MAG: YbaK/EbsC family protein [Deltaproteobacteria bacterium]|nr:YbaK/EbsC family protein [Deltaproteobacteria bacterium]
MPHLTSPRVRQVQEAMKALGHSIEVKELPDSTRTAQEAAQAVGCQVDQIAKSIVFRSLQTDRPVLVVTSGSNRVDEKKIGALLGEAIGQANADFVRQQTGYAIGGVAPVGHLEKVVVFIDQDLLQYDRIWAAAGTPHAVFQLTPAVLVEVTGGQVAAVA